MSTSFSLPRLRSSGSRIIDSTGNPVLLRGVNRSGLEYSQEAIPLEEINLIAQDWGANIVRLPFNQDWALHAPGYLELLDAAIEGFASRGAYSLLDLQWLDAERPFGPNRQFVAPLPNPDTERLWTMLARRYGANPAVLFDLFNEPHDRALDDPYPLWCTDGSQYHPDHRQVSMTEWQPWAEMLVDAIRSEAPDALIFVSGTEWGYDLRGFPLKLENLVYSTHVYPGMGEDWFGAFGYLARHVPVFAGEFGGSEQDLEWGRQLLDYFDELEMGWTAWSFTDRPHLVDRATMEPKEFGKLVQDRLRRLRRCRE